MSRACIVTVPAGTRGIAYRPSTPEIVPRRVPPTWIATCAIPWPVCASMIRPTIRPVETVDAGSCAFNGGVTRTRRNSATLEIRLMTGLERGEARIRLSRITLTLPQPRLGIHTEMKRIRHGPDRSSGGNRGAMGSCGLHVTRGPHPGYGFVAVSGPAAGRRQREPGFDRRTAVRFTFRAHPPAVRLHEVLDDGEPEAGATLVTRAGGIDAGESLEDPRQ